MPLELKDVGGPRFNDNVGWGHPQYYSTIQSQVMMVNGNPQLFLLARAAAGIVIQGYDLQTNRWTKAVNGPAMGDAQGWDKPQYYSTIQTQVVTINEHHHLILLARSTYGLGIWTYNPRNVTWQSVAGPDLSDKSGWAQPQYYSTIQSQMMTVKGKQHLFLLARAAAGIFIQAYDPHANTWAKQIPGPKLSDAQGWNKHQYYSTIQTQVAIIDGQQHLILLARSIYGIYIWSYNPQTSKWKALASGPSLSDKSGWGNRQYYSTIQVHALSVKGKEQLLVSARYGVGILMQAYDFQTNTWSNQIEGPKLSDAQGWNNPQYFSTIQSKVMAIGGQQHLILLARSACGIAIWDYDPNNSTWRILERVSNFSDQSGWAKPQYYSTIQASIMSFGQAQKLLLLARSAKGIVLNSYTPSSEIKSTSQNCVRTLINYPEMKMAKKIGEGSFGVVYQATYCALPVAVKQLRDQNPSADLIAAFKREMQIISQVKFPNIVHCYGICEQPKYSLVMEYMPKGSLFDVLNNLSQPLSWNVRYSIAIDIARGLNFLHTNNVLHRDIKSLNVLLGNQMNAKLADFGLAVKVDDQRFASNQAVGTWMAPELISGEEKYTTKADIYSLGITFWEIAARKLPFEKVKQTELIPVEAAKGMRDDIPPDCPKKFASIIKFCWDNDAQKRPTAGDVVRLLQESQNEDLASLSLGQN